MKMTQIVVEGAGGVFGISSNENSTRGLTVRNLSKKKSARVFFSHENVNRFRDIATLIDGEYSDRGLYQVVEAARILRFGLGDFAG